MENNGSFTRVLVSNIGTILASGSTENLAVGQIGIFDAETYQATTAPVYNKNKSIIIAQGMPGPPVMVKMGGLPGVRSEKTDAIKGNLIHRFRSFRGKRGQTDLVAIGYDGVDSTKTIWARKDEIKYLYIKLTGQPINKIASPNGLILRYSVHTGFDICCGPDCDDCATADVEKLVDWLVDQINKDSKHYGMVRAYKKVNWGTPPTAETTVGYTTYQLTIADMGDEGALGRVQAQYPNDTVTLYSRDGATSLSTYRLTHATSVGTPADFTTSTTTLIPDCPTCPSGYTASAVTNLYEITVPGGATVTSSQITNMIAKQLLSESQGRDTYLVSVNVNRTVAQVVTQVEAIAGWEVVYLRQSPFSCALDTPTTTAWTSAVTGVKVQRPYHLTLRDNECGSNRLAELVAAYAAIGTVTLVSGAPSGACTHIYSINVLSDFIEDGCQQPTPKFITPPGYGGATWVQVPPTADGEDGVFGIWLEATFTNRITGSCDYGYFDFEADGVHIQVSNYDPDYNAPPSQAFWPVTPLRQFQLPQNLGIMIKKLEEDSKEFTLRAFSMDVGVRKAEGYTLFADPNLYYDQYSLHYSKRIGVGGFSTVYEDRHIVNVYFPVGQGKQFADAINSYITSNPALPVEVATLSTAV